MTEVLTILQNCTSAACFTVCERQKRESLYEEESQSGRGRDDHPDIFPPHLSTYGKLRTCSILLELQGDLLYDHFSGKEDMWFDLMADTGDDGNSSSSVAGVLGYWSWSITQLFGTMRCCVL
ncbi:uncharacterized protein LOC110825721 [Carica papaya]|uniref:uncharacterized protein LOC110825721 n=1 Tax=Carica papaya TaxID=3649 RepID=UPI000B8CF531|nr:uncharacterized protein LOC110825721 [Carica papaya]